MRRYRASGAVPVVVDIADLQRMGMRCVFDDLLEVHGVVRHDAERLAKLLLDEFVAKQPPA
jgi:hypothetical protein